MENLGSLAAALVLAMVYALATFFKQDDEKKRIWSHRRTISAAAGVSVAYIFLDVLPELGAQHLSFSESGGGDQLPYAEFRIYLSGSDFVHYPLRT